MNRQENDQTESQAAENPVVNQPHERRVSAELRALANHSSLSVIGINSDGVMTSWNAAASSIFGYGADEAVGQSYSLLLSEDRVGELNKALHKVLRGRKVPEAETTRIRKDGSQVDVVFAIYPVEHGRDGKITGAVTTTLDISGRLRSEQAQKAATKQVEAIVTTIVDGLITIDAYGTINSFNPGATTIFQYRAHEVIGQNIRMLMPEPYHSEHDGYLEKYRDTQRPNVIGKGREVIGLRKDGSTFPMDLSVSEMSGADGMMFVGLVRDISDRKKSEQALREQIKKTERVNASLASTNKELAQTNVLLRDTQGQLVEAEKMASLGGLVAGVAHEINTPLGVGLAAATHFQDSATGIQQAYAEGQLKKSALEEFLETSGEASAMILSNLRRAADLVKSFKQISVDQTNSERREFDLEEYLQEIILSLKPSIQQSGTTVDMHCDCEIRMNSYPGALAQVITNLVMNAVTHAFEDGKAGAINLTVGLQGQMVQIEFRDNGKGIPKQNLAKIFDPFFTTRRNSGGTGLGLSVTFNLVTQTLGGTVNVDSEEGQGTWFTMLLPPVVEEVSSA